MNKNLSMKKSLAGMRGGISLVSILGLAAIILLAVSIYVYSTRGDGVPVLPGDGSGNSTSTGNVSGNGNGGNDDTERYTQKCGLKVTFPTIGTTASFPLPIKGIIDNRNRTTLGCSWTVFEAQAGTVRAFANINNQGWKSVSYWADNQSGAIAGPIPLMTTGDWMTESPVNVSGTVWLDPKVGKIPVGTPMKLVIEEEDPSGMGGETLEIPFVYSGENVETMSIKLFLPIDDHPTDCGQTYTVTRVVPKTAGIADASLKALLAETSPVLSGYYNGVTIKNKVATVDFDGPALSKLNAAACAQTMAKTPIEKTLLQYPTITKVEYSIDGVKFDEWDA